MSIENLFLKNTPAIEAFEEEALLKRVLAKTAQAAVTPTSTAYFNVPAEMSPEKPLHQVYNEPRPPMVPAYPDSAVPAAD